MSWLLVAVLVLLGLMWLELRSVRKLLEDIKRYEASKVFDRRRHHDEQQQMLYEIRRNTDDLPGLGR